MKATTMSIYKSIPSCYQTILVTLVVLLISLACSNATQQEIEISQRLANQDNIQQLQEIDSRFNNAEYDYVIQELKIYLDKYPESYKGWNLLGWAYLKNDQLEQAEQSFNNSIGINAEWDNSYVGKGALYRKLGDLDKANQSYQQVLSLFPENAEAYSSLVVIELMRGNDKKAVEYGEKAWELRQDLPSIPANLSIAYHYLGDFIKRDEFYGYAQELDYHNLQALQDIFDGKTSIR